MAFWRSFVGGDMEMGLGLGVSFWYWEIEGWRRGW